MSVLAYGAIVKRGEKRARAGVARAGDDGDSKVVAAVAALVPAEILAVHAAILSRTTSTDEQGATTITNAFVLQWSLPVLLVVAAVLFLISRGSSDWKPADFVRMLIPSVAFLVWTALIGTSALTPWIIQLPQAAREAAPDALFAAAVIIALLLVAVNGKVNPATS